MFHPRLYKAHPPTGRCSAGSAPRKLPFPAFSGTYPHLLCLLYYSGICRHFQVTMKFISGCFYTRLWSTRLWSQSSFLLSAPGVVTMTFSGVMPRNTSPTASLPSAVTSLNATGTTLSAPLAQVASVCPVHQEALSGENGPRFPEIMILFFCADIHLAPPKRKKITTHLGGDLWSGRRGSNSLPRPWQGRALPDELRPQTAPLLRHLGASGRSRTNDTRIFSPLLYQLSYRGIWRPRRGSNPRPPA